MRIVSSRVLAAAIRLPALAAAIRLPALAAAIRLPALAALAAMVLLAASVEGTVPRAARPQGAAVRASRADILAAMRPERGYDAATTANSGRFQANVYLRLARQTRSDSGAEIVLIDHEDWYQAFLEYSGLPEDELPELLRLMREHGQDAMLDLREGAVIKQLDQGRMPDLAMNVRLAFEARDDAADSYSYEDRLADPAVLVHNDSLVTFRLMDFGDQIFHDDIQGSKIRPLTGSLGALFAVIGLAEIRSVRMAVADDGTTVSIATARKALVTVPAAVTTSPWGRSERGVSPLRDDLLAIEQRLRQPLEFEYVEMDWDRVMAASRVLGGDPLPLEVQFIGNMAMRISDGLDTMYTDFPYRSGAAGYMEYSRDVLDAVEQGVALITHEHADHWDARAFARTELKLIAHPDIATGVDPDRVLPWAESIRYGGIEVQPVATPHTDAHVSYRVLWGGRRLYFSGDTESTDAILQERDLDVAFVSPWLLRTVLDAGEAIDADLIVVYHHLADEDVPTGPGIHVPTQRGRFVIR